MTFLRFKIRISNYRPKQSRHISPHPSHQVQRKPCTLYIKRTENSTQQEEDSSQKRSWHPRNYITASALSFLFASYIPDWHQRSQHPGNTNRRAQKCPKKVSLCLAKVQGWPSKTEKMFYNNCSISIKDYEKKKRSHLCPTGKGHEGSLDVHPRLTVTRTHTQRHTHTDTHRHRHTHRHKHTQTHTHIDTHRHIHTTHTHTHHTHTHRHIHTTHRHTNTHTPE